jgi:hypothetical protein
MPMSSSTLKVEDVSAEAPPRRVLGMTDQASCAPSALLQITSQSFRVEA